MPDSPSSKRRGSIDALVATAPRWNDRLSRPINGPPAPPVERSVPAPAAAPRNAQTAAPPGTASK